MPSGLAYGDLRSGLAIEATETVSDGSPSSDYVVGTCRQQLFLVNNKTAGTVTLTIKVGATNATLGTLTSSHTIPATTMEEIYLQNCLQVTQITPAGGDVDITHIRGGCRDSVKPDDVLQTEYNCTCVAPD